MEVIDSELSLNLGRGGGRGGGEEAITACSKD